MVGGDILPIQWSKRAANDLEEALSYIGEFNSEAAHRFKVAIIEGLEHVRNFPKSARMVPEEHDHNLREVLREPFRVIYEIHPKELRVITIRRMERAPLKTDELSAR